MIQLCKTDVKGSGMNHCKDTQVLEMVGGRTRIRTLDPLIKRLIVFVSDQVVNCKTWQNQAPKIKGLQTKCKMLSPLQSEGLA